MKELEEINSEIRKVVAFQLSVIDRLNNLQDNNSASNEVEGYNNSDSPCGGFLNDATYAWLTYGYQLVVVNVKTGESISSWTFRGKISCVCQFPAQLGELPLLLVGLDNEATRVKDSMGLLCVFDCTTSRVLRAIKMPAGVEQVCIVSGGAEWEEFNDKRPENILTEMSGIACVVLRNLYHLMIDLQRPTWEVYDSFSIMDETSPAEMEFLTGKDSTVRNESNKGRHAAYSLLNTRIEKHIRFNREEFESTAFLDEKLTSAVLSSTKIGCLISGCLGRVIIWENDGSVGWISLPVDENMIVTHFALLEPADDPRPFYYLWVVYQDESSKAPPLLRMYAMLFERKYCDRGTNLYFNLEAEPSLKFEFELDSNDRVVSLSPIERVSNPDQTESETKRGEDSLLLIASINRTLLFDLNQWYKEQMPQTIGECKNPNSILACYSRSLESNVMDNQMLSCSYVSNSLQEFPNNSPTSPEELFYPNSSSFEWVELNSTKLTFRMSRGIQAELLRELAIAGPIILTQPSEMFHKCLSVGLVPFNYEISFTNDHNVQREMLLSLCLEQRWATFLVRCVKEWSDGSAAYLYPNFLKWGIQRASSIKVIADRLCVPLFDQSGSNIGEAEVKTLRFCSQQLECLSNVVAKLPFETVDLIKQRRALKRVSMYFQVLLWFYDVGLLPESQDLEEGLPISLTLKIPYPFEKLFALYKEKRDTKMDLDDREDENEENKEVLFIDELISRECPVLKLQWERESGSSNNNGQYPPPSLQSLLRSYLTDSNQPESEIECKHQITIYLLMDLAMLLQGSYPGVDQLIKYPSAFKMSPSLIKLTQAFWLLDHEDYQGFLDMMTGQLVSDSDVRDWHHKLILKTLVRNNQHKLALTYLRVRKPPLSSVDEQSTLINLSVEHGLVQSAFHRRPQSHYAQLLTSFFQACKAYGKLSDILHLALDSEEEDVFVKFLENNKSNDMRLLYYLQRCRYTEANNGHLTTQSNTFGSKNLQATSFNMLNAYNATLPDVVKRFSVNMGKTNLDVDLESRYPRPLSHYKSSQRTLSIHENVIKKAKETYFRGDKSQIPFISAPCTSLKLNDERVNINCVLFPKIAQKSRKRTVDQIYEEEGATNTPDGAKRRKLLEGEAKRSPRNATLNATFNTPLVKRKSVANKEAPTETPHSILKIRQLIRSSTSPCMGSQVDVSESISEREKKVNRQIRFSIGQPKKSASPEETNGQDISKHNLTDQSEETFFSPNVSESTLHSDASCSSKNIYSPRPRPGLRSSSQTKELPQESFSRLSRSNSPAPVESSLVSRHSSQFASQSRTRNSLVSCSVQSSAILSADTTFETSICVRDDVSTDSPIAKHSASEECNNLQQPMEMDEDMESEVSYDKESETYQRSNIHEILEYQSREEVRSEYQNGAVSNTKTSYFKYTETSKPAEENTTRISDVEDNDDEEDFEGWANAVDRSENELENNERCWSRNENIEERCEDETAKEATNLRNGEIFDITDDESNTTDMVLAMEDSKDDIANQPDTVQADDNVFDASNITDDESDSNADVKSEAPSTPEDVPTLETSKRTRTSLKKDLNVSKHRKSLHSDNNNFTGEPADSPVSKNDKSLLNKRSMTASPVVKQTISMIDTNEESSVRLTRSRRASVSKEILAPDSPSKIVPEKVRRSSRASSLAKEVLTASIADGIRRTVDSGSEDTSTSTTKKTTRSRGKRAASIAKETAEAQEEKMPVRRSTRRATSVQKELPEIHTPTKSRAGSPSTSVTNNDEKPQVETKRKSSARSKSGKTKADEEVKPTRKRVSSVSKESVDEMENVEVPLETIKRQSAIMSSPAANTRNRRSSIHSVPAELEEILSLSSKEKATVEKKTNPRQRRAASVELSQTETKRRTRGIRARSVLKETIVEEEPLEELAKEPVDEPVEEAVEEPAEEPVEEQTKAANVKKTPTRRKRAISETIREVEESAKPRRGRKLSVNKEEQFLFSQPEKTSDQPMDQKALGTVPDYVFSPPHTRSKAIVSDQHRRRINNFIPILYEDEQGEEEKEQCIAQKTSQVQKPGTYIRVNRCRTKFVLHKRSKSTTD